MGTRIVSYHTHQGVKSCVVVPTARSLHIIIITCHGLTHVRKPLDEERYMRDSDAPLKKSLKRFGGIARRLGSTKAARTWLSKARESIS